ncbi:hypothetical protein C5167_025452 [Papaver somniferum]|uniref:THO complex subunit 2 n=1 Tax=Papaver somniferum TaxID=3469 RepID=A0A4Y7JRG6_PAPSO|nr:hypothetical protein C5167_025452 [Papaver somniferum]
MVCGDLPFQKCKVALDSVEFSDKATNEEMGSVFADIVSQMSQDLTMPGENRARLITVAKWLVESALVPLRLFQERCEEEFLWESEMIKIKAPDLKAKEVRVNTRLLYQQTKFNLLREESEGYAKLVTLLCLPQDASGATISTIKSLIGHFDLDPNRVFDIILECFELHPDNNHLFLDLIPIFPKSHASQILGFRFQYYQRMDVMSTVPSGLYQLAAALVKADLIDLDSIYSHLLPKDEDAFELYDSFPAKRFDEAHKIGKINLAATGKDLMEDENVTVDIYTALDMESSAVEEQIVNNQSLGLLNGFLSVDDWYHAHILFDRLSPLNPVAHDQICKGLFGIIEKSISSAYAAVLQTDHQNIHLPKELFQMLSAAGPYLYRNTLLLQKRSNQHLRVAKAKVEDALGTCILPSLQLIPANPAVGQEIWDLMCLLTYEARYHLYGEWEKENERIPMVLAARQTAKLDTRRILKRLAKENLKQLGRMVAKLAHANPMTVLRTIVHQIEAYRDMIAPVVDAFKYLTQLEYDILEGLFQYLVNQLKKGKGIELVLLQELIQQMANVQYTENMTEEQLDAMAGSETLPYQATVFGMTKQLRDSLLPKDEPKLALALLLLIAQHRALVVINADAPYIKMVSEQFDRCHGTLLQYVEFLNSALTPTTAYAQLIPPLEDLVHKYHLDPESESSILTSELVLDLGYPRKPIMWSELLDTVKEMLPAEAWNSLSPDLYATFWGLTLYDLYVPKSRYDSEITKQHAALKALEELSDNSSSAITKRKKDKERIQELLDRLTYELRKHEENAASVRQRLSREKDKWLSSCPDTLKINMEFLQRCIFPRCIFSMPDAVYCAQFVRTLHSLGTPFFNTVNHIDVLICKTLQPMICCCTEYEAGRLGRFLFETLEMAYHWKKKESTYERECGNMPGFAVSYRYPNSQRVTYSQFVRVHWKWSCRITRLLIQCLESNEYMEIRNALIMLTKISSVFPVTRKSGINLEKRVAKVKGDEREDLKVLATGVAAALASRKSLWVTDEKFCMGYVDLKPRKGQCDETMAKVAQKTGDSELKAPIASLTKQSKHDGIKDENKCVKPFTRHANPPVTSSSERPMDRSMERHGRGRSIERVHEGILTEQNLPSPPPLPSHMVPQSVSSSRRDEDADRKVSNTRHMQRLSPRHEEKDRRRSEEISLASDDAKRRREEKVNIPKDDLDTNAASKRRKLKRDHLSSSDVGEYPTGALPLPSPSVNMSQSLYDGRERAERNPSAIQRAGFMEEPSPKMHGKEAASKITRCDSDQLYEREWDDKNRLRVEQKRRHRK